jgi:hypothetical protein
MRKICQMLDLLYKSNKMNPRISYKEFYNESVNKDEGYKKVLIFPNIETNTQMV